MAETDQLRGPFYGNHIHGDSLGLAETELHVDPIADLPLLHVHSQVGVVRSETDHLPVSGSPVGLGRTADIDSLEDVRFPLGVIPVEKIGPRRKFKVKVPVVSEILKFK